MQGEYSLAMQHGTLEPPVGVKRISSPQPEWLTKAIIRTLLCATILVGIALLVLSLIWPFTEQALIDILQKRSVRSVTIDHFRITYFPPGCVAQGISFLHRK